MADEGIPASKVLRRAAEIVEQGWCQGAYARSADGQSVDERDPRAVRWCMAGAHFLAAHQLGVLIDDFASVDREDWLVVASGAPWNTIPGVWNDAPGRTADDVADLLRRAADLADASPRAERGRP